MFSQIFFTVFSTGCIVCAFAATGSGYFMVVDVDTAIDVSVQSASWCSLSLQIAVDAGGRSLLCPYHDDAENLACHILLKNHGAAVATTYHLPGSRIRNTIQHRLFLFRHFPMWISF